MIAMLTSPHYTLLLSTLLAILYGGEGPQPIFHALLTWVPIESLHYSGELDIGQGGRLMALSDANATQPVTVTWNFGNGRTGLGMSTSQAFSAPGTYPLTESYLVTVAQPQIAPTLINRHEPLIQVNTTGDGIVRVYGQTCDHFKGLYPVPFDSDSSDLTSRAERLLKLNLKVLQDCDKLRVRIILLADAAEKVSQTDLSSRRVIAVRDFYTSRGYPRGRISVGSGRTCKNMGAAGTLETCPGAVSELW